MSGDSLSGQPVPPPRIRLVMQCVLAVCVVVAMLTATIALELRTSNSFEASLRDASASRSRIDEIRSVIAGLLDAETGQRGYLLTRRRAYLDSYDAGLVETRAGLAALAANPSGDQADLAALAEVAARKNDELARTIEVADHQGTQAALEIVLTNEGKRLMEDARARADGMVSRLFAQKMSHIAALRTDERDAAIWTVAAATVGAMLLGGGVLVLLFARVRAAVARTTLDRLTKRLCGTIDALPEGVAVFDQAGRLALWNRGLFVVAGLPPGLAAVGTPWSAFAAAASGWPRRPLEPQVPPPGMDAVEVALEQRTDRKSVV